MGEEDRSHLDWLQKRLQNRDYEIQERMNTLAPLDPLSQDTQDTELGHLDPSLLSLKARPPNTSQNRTSSSLNYPSRNRGLIDTSPAPRVRALNHRSGYYMPQSLDCLLLL